MHAPLYLSLRSFLAETAKALLPEGCSVPVFGDMDFFPPEDGEKGELCTNVGFSLAALLKRSPQEISQHIAAALKGHPAVAEAHVIGGFCNLFMSQDFWRETVRDILAHPQNYGYTTDHAGQKVNVEYISANPTGPLHGGHGRICVVGDVLANLLEAVGYDVTREYYVNDAGVQIAILARSVYAHYQSLCTGQEVRAEEGMYPGAYVTEIAEALYREHGEKLLEETRWLPVVSSFAVGLLLENIREDLGHLGVHLQVFTSEASLHQRGLVEECVTMLLEKDLAYRGFPPALDKEDASPRGPCVLFRSTAFGDDQDRVLQKSTGEWTYFAGDVAYHVDKFRRGFSSQIDVWGADHGGHVLRTQAAVKAITQVDLQVLLCQMVNFSRGGVPFKMSKRDGTFITLREILQDVDADAFRFYILTKKCDTPLNLDLEMLKEQTKDNPVFYVQYAHARCCSVLRAAEEFFPPESLRPEALCKAPLTSLGGEEIALLRFAVDWHRQLRQAAAAREPHRLATFLYKFATLFHGLWQKGNSVAVLRFLQPQDLVLSYDRMAFLRAVSSVIASGLRLCGVVPKEEMR